jgi:hypothetical protein
MPFKWHKYVVAKHEISVQICGQSKTENMKTIFFTITLLSGLMMNSIYGQNNKPSFHGFMLCM